MDDTSHSSPAAPNPAEPDDHDWVLLACYVSGEATAAERACVESWADRSPERRAELDALRCVPAVWARLRPAVDGQPAWERMRERMATPGAAPRPFFSRLRGKSGDTPRTWPRGVGGTNRTDVLGRLAVVGAVVVVIAAIGVIGRTMATRPAAQPFHEFVTTPGSRSTITLRDGTRLVLGPATRVRVPADFGHGRRVLELDGEVYFNVVHDPQQPFAVQTARALVRDVGTTFVVRAYAGDAGEKIAVLEGEVALGDAALKAHDAASVDATGDVTIRRGVDVASYIAWTQGTLVFEDTPLRDAARDLGRAFDLDVIVTDSTLATRRLTAAFGDDPVDEVLDAVAQAVGGRYERIGRRVVIRARGVAREPRRTVHWPLATAQRGATN